MSRRPGGGSSARSPASAAGRRCRRAGSAVPSPRTSVSEPRSGDDRAHAARVGAPRRSARPQPRRASVVERERLPGRRAGRFFGEPEARQARAASGWRSSASPARAPRRPSSPFPGGRAGPPARRERSRAACSGTSGRSCADRTSGKRFELRRRARRSSTRSRLRPSSGDERLPHLGLHARRAAVTSIVRTAKSDVSRATT